MPPRDGPTDAPTSPPRDAAPPIRLRGVRQNNLKGIDVEFPYDRFTVVTGVSGSGKSSLVFDTLYAEGQRRYVESFSAYARQFLERMPRPAADAIDDLPPAVAVEQANPVRTSRSTVGTMTELTDHLKLLFAKAATLHCAKCGAPVEPERPEHVADAVEALPAGTKALLAFPWPPSGGLPIEEQVAGLRAAGYVRMIADGRVAPLDDRAQPDGAAPRAEVSRVAETPAADARHPVADRFVAGRTERSRVLGSAEQAFRHGRGRCSLWVQGEGDTATVHRRFSSELHCAACDLAYRPAVANLFSFNSPLGACPTCRGFGRTIEPNLAAIVPDPRKSLSGGAIKPWTTPRTRPERRELEQFCKRRGIDFFRPWDHLPAKHRKEILDGTKDFFGIAGWMKWLEGKSYKMHVRVLLARYRTYVECGECRGTRRRPESLAWRLGGRNVHEWECLPIADAFAALRALRLSPQAEEASQIVREGIDSRLSYLVEVGLGYLTLDRATKTLSGGEFQRVNLATALGATLVNTLYVLDEPSIGLHPRDTDRLLGILRKLRDRGNTLVVVEHDPETILAADHVVDLGPGAGAKGGEVLFRGPLAELPKSPTSLTARFLRGEESVRPRGDGVVRRPAQGWLEIRGCRGHNLKDAELRIPRDAFTAVCGVSGSGKSSLVLGTLLPAMLRRLGKTTDEPLPHAALAGAEAFSDVVLVDQSPIGRTPRSNPVTYTGAMTHLRNLLGRSDSAVRMGLGPKAFSFNSRGGRCSACDGAGAELLEMQFLADVFVPCAECEGKRFKPDVLEVRFRGRNVHEILQMTVDDAIAFFGGGHPSEWKLRDALIPLQQVGLGYLQLGQSATTLSGGEAQRLKLASYLPRGRQGRARRGKATLFLFDEPTTGLHLADVRTLLECLHRLVDSGHTVVVIEHHMDVVRSADHVIEVGPEGGEEGGRILATGTPEEVAAAGTVTGRFLGDGAKCFTFPPTSEATQSRRRKSETLSPVPRLRSIRVEGCHVHNLRGVGVEIPHGKLTVVTGVSGSGKSSLAFDTVFAEGRRRYLESLSAYARQFVEQVPRPDVDRIDGLPPTVSIDQRTTRGGIRQTVASMAEILEYVRLLWARLGVRHCERCGDPVTAMSVDRIVDRIAALVADRKRKRVHLLAPMVQRRKGFHRDVFDLLARLGIDEARVDGARLATDPPPELSRFHEHSIEALVATVSAAREAREELHRAVETTLDRGGGTLFASLDDELATVEVFSSVAACVKCGTAYGPLDPGELSWTMKAGMCRTCKGTGFRESDEDDGGEPEVCRQCEGARLSPAARAVRFRGIGLHQFLAKPVDEARRWLAEIAPESDRERAVFEPVRDEVASRLEFLERVGLAYLSLDRTARSLSGGESQRVRLASQLGTGLRGACYVLDEPTIGLHPVDNARLLGTIRALCDRGATALVVEHDEDTIAAADHVIDVGPGAGRFGGTIVAEGPPAVLAREGRGVTGPWLAGKERIDCGAEGRVDWRAAPAIVLRGVTARNLKGIDVPFPTGALTCVTGVSGSGKSTLVREVLGPALLRALGLVGPEPGAHGALEGASLVQGVLEIDQSPIGKTSRSVPATYTGIMDPLRALYAESVEARMRGFGISRFSFNSKEGPCGACNGQGRVTVEMNFLPDVAVPCETCGGRRYDEETLAVRFHGRTIAETLAMTIADARPAFASFPKIARILDVLDEVGLGYLELGQPSPTLSGGEAQRIKLAAEMAKRGRGRIVYLLDEPTTGLHFADVAKLVKVLRGLVALGNTVVVIEHHLDVIAAADLVVDLGPGGGASGGRLVACGSPEEVAATDGSATGACLQRKLGARGQRSGSTENRRRPSMR